MKLDVPCHSWQHPAATFMQLVISSFIHLTTVLCIQLCAGRRPGNEELESKSDEADAFADPSGQGGEGCYENIK